MAWALLVDGIPCNKRSSESLIPLIGCLLNLPPKYRSKFSNMFIFGYWIGKGQPNMQHICAILTEEFEKMSTIGVTVQKAGVNISTKSFLVYADADMKMKILLLNTAGPTCKKGCCVCNFEGIVIIYSNTNRHAIKFPIFSCISLYHYFMAFCN